jgi:peroxiredoxin
MRTLAVVATLLAAAPALAAQVGRPAPDFTLRDLDGRPVRLSDHRGKIVVLEWFNPGCPFVVASHTRGTLKGAAAREARNGVVWLAVNSGAPGKQGHGVEVNRAAAKDWGMDHPILLDEAGDAGRAYDATNTPHMYVVDAEGTLAYRGAIDNSPDGERQSPQGGTVTEYVTAALEDLRAGRPVRTAETKAYGCGVKYGK